MTSNTGQGGEVCLYDDLEPGDLRPCPFCGGEASRVDCEDEGDDNFGGSFICCTECEASGPVVFGYKETLYSSWNERVYRIPSPTSNSDEEGR